MPYINIPLAPFKGGIKGDKGKIYPENIFILSALGGVCILLLVH